MNTLPNGTPRSLAESRLALYDARVRGGYKNQVIGARSGLRITGMAVRDLRKWLADNPA